MCTYCNMGDHQFRYNPPWEQQHPLIPRPVYPQQPINPWAVEQLREYLHLLKQVKDMEEKIGCPCEPNKADYIKLFEERIAALEKRQLDGY